MIKTGQFRAKPDPRQILSVKFFAPKKFESHLDFKNKVFQKTGFWPEKPESEVWEPVRNIKIAYESLFLVLLLGFNIQNYKKGAKPETGQSLSGIFFLLAQKLQNWIISLMPHNFSHFIVSIKRYLEKGALKSQQQQLSLDIDLEKQICEIKNACNQCIL